MQNESIPVEKWYEEWVDRSLDGLTVDQKKTLVHDGQCNLLGQCVMAFSKLEELTDLWLAVLAKRHGMNTDASLLLAINLPLREKCSAIVALAFLIDPDEKLMDRIASVTNKVCVELRNQRNRLFHDVWSRGDYELIRRPRTGTKLTRPQSRQVELKIPDQVKVTHHDLGNFIKECVDMSNEIISLSELFGEEGPQQV